MNFKTLLKTAIPFIIGLLIGAGVTKQYSSIAYILIGYIIFMFVFGLLKDKILKVKDSENKEDALKHEAMVTIKDIGEATLKGNDRGANLFDKYYGDYIFYVNVALFITMIFLAVWKLWLWVLVCFLGMQFHMVLNQNVRMTREIKEKLEKVE